MSVLGIRRITMISVEGPRLSRKCRPSFIEAGSSAEKERPSHLGLASVSKSNRGLLTGNHIDACQTLKLHRHSCFVESYTRNARIASYDNYLITKKLLNAVINRMVKVSNLWFFIKILQTHNVSYITFLRSWRFFLCKTYNFPFCFLRYKCFTLIVYNSSVSASNIYDSKKQILLRAIHA